MLAALAKAIGQVAADRRLRRVVWRSLAVAAAVFVALWAAAWWGLGWAGTALADWLAAGGFWQGLVEGLVALGGLAAVLIASFLLFPAVVGVALSLFVDEAAAAVEARHYPHLPAARGQPLGEALKDVLALAAATVVLNLLVLPLYLLLSLLPPLNVFVFYGLNGYLLGREYFEQVAARRLPRTEARALRRRHAGRVVLAGVLIALLLTVPIVNLLTPVVATAFMLHVFEGLRARAGRTAAARA